MKKYQVIYADPPWRYDFSLDSADKVERHYPTMSLEEIKAVDVPTDDNAVLYLWAPAPKTPEALEVMKAWGFTYKTNAAWDKGWIGMGYWFRGQHELLHVGTKGDFSPPKPKDRVSSMITVKRTEHSRKPDSVRDIIAKSFPNTNKLELFARQRIDGWDTWGNEPVQLGYSLVLEDYPKAPDWF